jgi:hypothetical protein
MNRRSLAIAACAVGVGGLTLARHDEKGGAKVTQLSRRDIVEKLDGKDARVTVEEVTIEPGGQVRPHRHTGPVFGYVLEGEYDHALNDDRVTTYKAGDTFYEPSDPGEALGGRVKHRFLGQDLRVLLEVQRRPAVGPGIGAR